MHWQSHRPGPGEGFGFNLQCPLGTAAVLHVALSELHTHESFEVDQAEQFG